MYFEIQQINYDLKNVPTVQAPHSGVVLAHVPQ